MASIIDGYEQAMKTRKWFTSFPETDDRPIPIRTFINHIHYDMLQAWTFHRRDNGDRIDWFDHINPPPWKPTLHDVIQESDIKDLYDEEQVLHTINYRKSSKDKITSLNILLSRDHINHIKSIADNECIFLRESEDSLTDDDILNRLAQWRPGTFAPNSIPDISNKKNLCHKGINILDRMMETQSLQEEDYKEMCNIFRELHR